MKSSVKRAVRLLASVAAVIAVLGFGFAAARASADPGGQVAEMRRMHEETHATHPGMGIGAHSAAMEGHARPDVGAAVRGGSGAPRPHAPSVRRPRS